MLYDVYICFAMGRRMPTDRIVERGPVRGVLTFECPQVGSSRHCFATLTGPDGKDLIDPLTAAKREYLEDGDLLITGREFFGQGGPKSSRSVRSEQQWLCRPVKG
jgi:hypothetical protein